MYSNIQSEQSQYDSCNASAGSGLFLFNGFCLTNDTLEFMLTINSQSLSNAVNFGNDRIYYLTSKIFNILELNLVFL